MAEVTSHKANLTGPAMEQSRDTRTPEEDQLTILGGVKCCIDPEVGSLRVAVSDGMGANGFEHVCILIDPGAFHRTFPLEDCNEVPLVVARESKAGHAYEAAGDHIIVNEGQRHITFMPQGGSLNRMDFQVTVANEALGSGSEVVGSGHRVILGKKEAYIENMFGGKTSLRRCNGMWYLDVWRVPQFIANGDQELSQFFSSAWISNITPRFVTPNHNARELPTGELHMVEPEGALKIIARGEPIEPNADEVRNHNLTHQPYRSW